MTTIKNTLDLLCPNAPVEIRVLLDKMLPPKRFATHDEAEQWAVGFPNARAIYTVLNPFDAERISGAGVDDASVVRRHWLLIDVDPQRPPETNASDEEIQAAGAVAGRIKAFLATHSWSAPVEALSGNGAHLLYRIDLPNDDASRQLIEALLKYLAATFNTSTVHVDTSVYNASRITKLYGTMTRKGPDAPGRPGRPSALTYAPDPLLPVSLAALSAVSSLSAAPKKPKKAGRTLLYDMQRVLKRVEVFKTWVKDGTTYYQIRCPWVAEHSDNPDGGTILTVSTAGAPGFKCQHSHCQARGWQTLRDHLGITTERQRTLDPSKSIIIEGGQLTSIVDRIERVLLKNTTIYQRGGQLTRAIKLDTAITNDKDVRREAGSTMLIPVREPWLIEKMGQALPWLRYEQRAGDYVVLDPPPLYARTLLGRGEWSFPVLRGVITSPTLNREGQVIEQPGFNATSGLLLDFPAGAFPPVPPHPTQDDALAALRLLASPLRSFPFIDEAALAVALSGMLTALVRLSLRTAPLHSYDAPTAGTGKSLLAEMVGLLVCGTRPPAMSQGKSEEEDEKRLSTVLFAGDPVIHIDNCERAISGDFLCSMLSQEVVQARILGFSERRILPSTALVLASGNNLIFAGDTSRRSVVCRLDAKVERPDQRNFDFDCHAEVMAARPRLVIAGLTVLAAYHHAGRSEKLTPMGSFTDWEWVRGALVWLGCADPADTRRVILDNDPKKDELLSVMSLWEQALGDMRVEVSDINSRESTQELRNKLIEVACHRGAWSGKSVGWWLRRNKDRMVGGRCLRCEQGAQMNYWWLAGAGMPLLPEPGPREAEF